MHILAKSLKAYQTEQPGHVDLVLLRAIDWLMKPSHHKYHSGDAGPKFYVPDARSQRETTIECALLISEAGPDDIRFHQAVDQYICAPLLFTVDRSSGTRSHVPLLDDQIVISSLHQYKGKRLARAYNPTSKPVTLHGKYATLAQDEREAGSITSLAPKAIASIALAPVANANTKRTSHVTLINWPEYPIQPDTSKPDTAMLAQLEAMHARLQQELDELTASLDEYDTDAPHSLQHRYYVVARECMEARLSLLWNKRRAEQPVVLTEDYAAPDADAELHSLAIHYNDLRIMRRMYDYIIGIDENDVVVARPAHHADSNLIKS